ncbi:unnamed protein product [Eruca vesicaria subsp. sativa]|uniref:Uncharacterized protein n=1 Tax=Eruca vesicaria subsp. sativa TaxID=29727 RepID=A0ABC8LNU9_ERUVS|nr:unnamed protein product [Eruca vesicaria subsp. sativa]
MLCNGDGSDGSKKTWWLNRLMGQRKKITHNWPYTLLKKGSSLFLPFKLEWKVTTSALMENISHLSLTEQGRLICILDDANGLAPQKHLEMQSMWKAPALPGKPVELFIGVLSAGNHFYRENGCEEVMDAAEACHII